MITTIIACVIANMLTILIIGSALYFFFKKNEEKIQEIGDRIETKVESLKEKVSNVFNTVGSFDQDFQDVKNSFQEIKDSLDELFEVYTFEPDDSEELPDEEMIIPDEAGNALAMEEGESKPIAETKTTKSSKKKS